MKRSALLVGLAASACSSSPPPTVRVVTQNASATYVHFTTIQSAVDAAKPGDWILIDVGTYNEAVTIATPGLHVRGMDRNMVVLDGQHMVGNGIEVAKANDVTIENLTVHDYDRPSLDGDDGNQIWWNGGDGSGKIGLSGWNGSYLTTYATGLLGGYGLFVSNSVHGSMDNVYASGFNDSGVYLGACRDCQATISNALVENCALGYSGTNAGGHIVIQNSTFQNNSNGIGPNSLNNDDQPPPADGACNAGQNTTATPTFSSTSIDRCTIFKNNIVANNNNFTTPANTTAASIPWGAGFILIGTYADLVEGNTITGNSSAGILGFENPYPFPITDATVFFQLAGNKISNNTFSGNGTNSDPNAADIVLVGGLFGQRQSMNNCLTGNTLTKTTPPDLATTWDCSNSTTPNPGSDAFNYLLALQSASQARTSMPQPAPPAQPTMPDPCSGAPKNPLCP
jgi:nitrous oxidase accessory protein NosD